MISVFSVLPSNQDLLVRCLHLLLKFFLPFFSNPVTQRQGLDAEVLPRRAGACWAADWCRTWRCLPALPASRQRAEGHSGWVSLTVTGPLEPSSSPSDFKNKQSEDVSSLPACSAGSHGPPAAGQTSSRATKRPFEAHKGLQRRPRNECLECSQHNIHFHFAHLTFYWSLNEFKVKYSLHGLFLTSCLVFYWQCMIWKVVFFSHSANFRLLQSF